MGIQRIIGQSHGGADSSWSFVSEFLRDRYIKNASETARRAAAIKRDAYFHGKGDEHIEALIDKAFQDPTTRTLRKAMVPWGKHNNVLRRVSSELATVYNEPARRSVADGPAYELLVDAVNLDSAMREVDEKLVYHEDVWCQYRVRVYGDKREPVIDVVSPANFWAVADPRDATKLVAIILDQTPDGAPVHAPHYLVWTDEESFALDKECRFITDSLEPNHLGRLPGVLASVRPPTFKGRLLAECPAADLTAAHEAIWFINVLLVKETKSANTQTYHTGDTSTAALGQTADTESDVVLPEGVTTQAIDRGMDLGQFIATATHILESAAANHGLPPSVLHQRDAASGAEIHLRRIPIRELRKKRIPIMRRVERDLAAVMSGVNALVLPEFQFDAAGWVIDFGEVQQPLTELESLQVFEEARRIGLTDTLVEIRRRNPDLTSDEEALKVLERHIGVETERVKRMRELQAASGSMGTDSPDVPRAQDGTPVPQRGTEDTTE
jgi:hypothetical protein